MTPVDFTFLTPDGQPLGNADVAIQLLQSTFDAQETGVLMPRLITATTDADGKVTVALEHSTVQYQVSVYDTESDVGLSYKFYVPVLGDTNTSVRFQDLIVQGSVSATPWDTEAMQMILDAKANAMSAQVAAATSEINAKAAADYAAQSINTVAASATNAATSETNAAISATSATTSALLAGQHEINASGNATSASGNAASALASSQAALASQTAAHTSEINAKTSENNAKTSETNAGTSAASATVSATAAATSKTNASTSEANALASKNAAATSATNAGNSATAAATSASTASDAATSATNNASTATTAATTATTQAGVSQAWATQTNAPVDGVSYGAKKYAQDASASATTATSQASAAGISAGNAANSATAAAGSATAAQTQATTATTKAGEASISALTAQDWASKATPVAGSLESAKTYAAQAAASAASASSSASAAVQGQIQADWNQTDNTQKSFIVNKPVIPSTAAQIGLGNVENKSSATIRGELTKANVVSALGDTPLVQKSAGPTFVYNDAYGLSAVASADGAAVAGSWSRYHSFRTSQAAAASRAAYGAYGDANGVNYLYFGIGTDDNIYNSANNLRITPTGLQWGVNTVWHAGNDGAGSGLDADMLDGWQPSTGASGNTIMSRDSNGSTAVVNIALNHSQGTRTNDTVFYSTPAGQLNVMRNTLAGMLASLGLDQVTNTSDANKPVSTAAQTALNLKANLASPTFTGTVGGITAAMVGLDQVNNTADANKPVSAATQSALDLKAPLASPTFTGTVSGVTAAMVGLGNVENKSSAAILAGMSSGNVTSALGYVPTKGAAFTGNGAQFGVIANDIRNAVNPTSSVGYAAGARFRFSSMNDDNATPYADVIDLSTYTDSTGGAINALYFNKASQQLVHKFALAGATVWTAKQLAYTDSNITGTAANITGTAAVANGGTGATTVAQALVNLGLNNVNNTADANKPISSATQTAINSTNARVSALEANSTQLAQLHAVALSF